MHKTRISIRGVKSITMATPTNMCACTSACHLGISDADSIHAKRWVPAIQCCIPEPFWAFNSSVATTFQSTLIFTTSSMYLWISLLTKRFPKTKFPFTRQDCFMGTGKRTSLQQLAPIILIKFVCGHLQTIQLTSDLHIAAGYVISTGTSSSSISMSFSSSEDCWSVSSLEPGRALCGSVPPCEPAATVSLTCAVWCYKEQD